MSHCPDDTELAGFLNESLAAERLTGVSNHVDGCQQCQARLDRLTEQTSGAVARYKEVTSSMLMDARSGEGVSQVDDTQLMGGKAAMAALLKGVPRVPGFDVASELGRGGMGVVYRARHRRLNRLVALKMILAGSAADPRIVQRFLFEAEVLARIQHPQVVQVFEVDTYEGPNGVPIPYLAMELLEGGSLSRKLREQAAASNGSPRWPTPIAAAELIEGIARAVHSAHAQGVIHRDLKPGNILFTTPDGTSGNIEVRRSTDRGSRTTGSKTEAVETTGGSGSSHRTPQTSIAKVTDFGLAKFIEAGADLTHSGQIVGTPQYMAPEQAAGSRTIGPQADVYSIGAILFECLTGRPPFTGSEPMSVLLKVVNEAPPDVRTLRPEVPRDLGAVTMKCLEKEPSRRYASAEALADDLRRFLEDRPTHARPVTSLERLKLWGRRNPAVAGLLAALAVVLCTTFLTVSVLWARAEAKAEDERLAKTRAELAQQHATREADNAAAALLEAQRRKAMLEFSRAVASCEEGRVRDGLDQFLLAAELAEETGLQNLARVTRVNLAAWPREVSPPPLPLETREQPRIAIFHPDGKHLVSAGRLGELCLWNVESMQRVRTYRNPPGLRPSLLTGTLTYWSVAISPDGKTIAAGGSDRYITLWNIESSEPRQSFEALSGDSNVWAIGFTSDSVLWSNDGKNGLKLWDLTAKPRPTAKLIAPPTPNSDDVLQTLTISPDGKRLFTGDRRGIIREWDVEKAVHLRFWRLRGWITDITISPDGKQLAATGSAGAVWVVDVRTAQTVHEFSLGGAYGHGVAFASKQPFLVASDADGNVRFWHRDTGHPIGIPMRFHGDVMPPRFHADSDRFAVAVGNAVYLCDLPQMPGELLSAGRGYRARGLTFSPTGDHLAATDEINFALFDTTKREQIRQSSRVGRGPLTLCYDADPTRPIVYRGTRDGFERFSILEGEKSESVEDSRWMGRVFRIASLPGDGGLFAMGQPLVARFDPVTLKRLVVVKPAPDIPVGVDLDTMAVRPDGKEVLVAFANRVVFLDGVTLEPLREWRSRDALLDACYLPDGKSVLVGRRDNAAELLDGATGTALIPPMPHARAVTSVAVSPDGTLLLTGSRDGTARFWDAASGLPMGPPLRHTGSVTHVAFSPKGNQVATATDSGHILIWDVPPPAAAGTVPVLRDALQAQKLLPPSK